MEYDQRDRVPFRGEVAHWTLGDVQVSRVAATSHVAPRTSGMIALRDVDCFKVGVRDPAHFNPLFKATYGQPPGHDRASGSGAPRRDRRSGLDEGAPAALDPSHLDSPASRFWSAPG